MPGLEPGIHVFSAPTDEGVDGRVKPGHDVWDEGVRSTQIVTLGLDPRVFRHVA
jgi:hypothetical protein